MNQRVKMIKTLAPVEIPNGTLGTVTNGDIESGMAQVTWDNGYVLPMYRGEVELLRMKGGNIEATETVDR